jgi:hypothetical protein
VGEFRITVPIYQAGLYGFSFVEPPQRWVLAPDVELTLVDLAESRRLENSGLAFTTLRLELFGLRPANAGDCVPVATGQQDLSEAEVGRRLARILNLHSLVVRAPFRAMAGAVDQFDGSVWRRVSHLSEHLPLRRYGGPSYMPPDRIRTWSTLLQEWPQGREKLDLALDLYAGSVEARWDGRHREALLAAASATEVLLSSDNQEITHKISQRAAHLVSPGADGVTTFRRIKKLYGLRSKVVHSGSPADDEACTEWQQFLMAAIPRAAAYAGSDKQLIEDLDLAGFERSSELTAIDGDGWWSYCDYVKCVGASSTAPGTTGT